MTHLQRSANYLREKGYRTAKVEFYNVHVKKFYDLFGVVDLLAVSETKPTTTRTLGVQVTDTKKCKAHREAMQTGDKRDDTLFLLRAGWRLECHCWGKYKRKRGGKATEWKLNRWVANEIDGEVGFTLLEDECAKG